MRHTAYITVAVLALAASGPLLNPETAQAQRYRGAVRPAAVNRPVYRAPIYRAPVYRAPVAYRAPAYRANYYPAYRYPAYRYPLYGYNRFPYYRYPVYYTYPNYYYTYPTYYSSYPTYTYPTYYYGANYYDPGDDTASALAAYAPAAPLPYAAAAPAPATDRALLDVRLPVPTAELWIEGERTTQLGSERNFYSPPLTAGKDYTYNLRARWIDGGQTLEQTRSVSVRAGQQVSVEFTTPR